MKIRTIAMLIFFGFIVFLFARSLHQKSSEKKMVDAARQLHSADIKKEILGCENGYAPACMTMGKIYKNGYYFQDKSFSKAASYFEKGCNINIDYEESCTLLADLISSNNGLELTSITERELYTKVCNFSSNSSKYCDLVE